MSVKNRGIFLDRDGTLNEDIGYISKIENFHLIAGVKPALLLLKEMGFKLFVVTNQSGVGRGIIAEEMLKSIHHRMVEEFQKDGIELDAISYCPHRPEEKCLCRKPQPKMLKDLAKRYGIDLKKSYLIGDKISDVLTGKNASCKTILLLSENEGVNLDEDDDEWPFPDYVADNLGSAAEWILKDSGVLESMKAEMGIKRKS
ncbi:MAG: D-glycero-beta-D-manno-heptose 1,7-bisphosphate 7-phosphatase [Chlamydiae bacterium]|nr:D-glycero-beta-D-manno-heptose 1,7-bisphosphate 7-phosphatase [Chlamydiota bacterium]MBI3267067.1 D-glycero-beta-D-manno-heptose 1,7-bisphosphate 7-phosphatase [Chlamydiota bacterium]